MQEPITTAVLLVHSMIKTFQPFLIVTTYDSRSRWEANFERLVPSVDVVVYSGSRDNRNRIRASEFYDEGGHMIVQVLLSSVEAILEVWISFHYYSCLDSVACHLIGYQVS